MSESNSQMNKTAAAIAHRACCGTEHDAKHGKLHGYCVVCGVPWPCETAQMFLATNPHDELVGLIQMIYDHEEGCRGRGVGFDDIVWAACEKALSKEKQT